MPLRQIGNTGIQITSVAMGCWPITGITSINVDEQHSMATIEAAFEAGINFFDTAFSYGYEGQSEKMLGRVLGPHREHVVIATKGGIHWEGRQQGRDGTKQTLLAQCEASLKRLNTDYVDLYYLHAPDPNTPIAESAAALRELLDAGKTRSVGVSNVSTAQLQEFADVCPLSAYQPHYNMLQREIETEQLPWCIEHNVSVMVYWPLMKGLLAGKLARDHQFDERDGRKKYPMFQGEEWERNQDFLDALRPIAEEAQLTLAQLVVSWTIQRTGITSALCGAKRPEQIQETAVAMNRELTPDETARINAAIEQRGPIISRAAV